LLVPFDPVDDPSRSPRDPERFARAIAERVNRLLADPEEGRRMGAAGRERAVSDFSWASVAERVHALYRTLV
jgi:starch synthase